MPKKSSGPPPDGSVLLVLYNPFGLPSTEARVGSIMQYGNNPNKDVIYRIKQILRWLAHLGLSVTQIFGKRTELAVIVDVQESDEGCIEAAIGMHRWEHYLTRCPQNWRNEASHIYRCVSTSIQHLERSLGFTEYLGIDSSSLEPGQLRTDGTFAYPYPAPSLPKDDRWPPRQSGLTLYVRPKALLGTKLAPTEEVDDFLNSIALTQPNSEDTVIESSRESATHVKSESDNEDQPTPASNETIAVKLEESELADTAGRAKDVISRLRTENESLDPLEGFDLETRRKMLAILQSIGITDLAELPSDFLTKLKESVASQIQDPESRAENPMVKSRNKRSPPPAKKRKDSNDDDLAPKRVKVEEPDW